MTTRAKLSAVASVVQFIARQTRPNATQIDVARALVDSELRKLEKESLRYWSKEETR